MVVDPDGTFDGAILDEVLLSAFQPYDPFAPDIPDDAIPHMIEEDGQLVSSDIASEYAHIPQQGTVSGPDEDSHVAEAEGIGYGTACAVELNVRRGDPDAGEGLVRDEGACVLQIGFERIRPRRIYGPANVKFSRVEQCGQDQQQRKGTHGRGYPQEGFRSRPCLKRDMKRLLLAALLLSGCIGIGQEMPETDPEGFEAIEITTARIEPERIRLEETPSGQVEEPLPEQEMPEARLSVTYFYLPGCGACKAIAPDMEAWASACPDVEWKGFDLSTAEGTQAYLDMADDAGLDRDRRSVPQAVAEGDVMIGRFEIQDSLPRILLSSGGCDNSELERHLEGS